MNSISADPTPRTRWHFSWVVFAAACVISFVGFGLTMNTASIYWGPLTEDLGVPLADVSLMSTVSGVAGAIALGIASPLFEKINLKLFLTVMVVLTAGAYLLSASATDMWALYIANLVLGVTKAVAIVLSIPVLLGNWFEKHLGLVTGIAGAMTAVGGAVFSPIIGSIISAQGWRTAYVVTAIIVLVALLPFTLFVTKLRPTGDQRPYGYDPERANAATSVTLTGVPARRAFRSLPFVLFAVVGILLQFAGALVQHLPTYFTTIGLPLTVAASVFSVLLIGASVGKFAIGAAIDWLSPITALAIFTLIALFGWGGMWLFSGELPLSVASFAGGMGQAINLVAVVVLVRNVFGALDYSKILGPILMVGSLANAGGAYIHGLLYGATGGYTLSFAMNIAIFIVSFVLLLVAVRSGARLSRKNAVAIDAAASEADAAGVSA